MPAFFVIYLATAFFWRSYLIWKQTGINPYVLGSADTAHDFIGILFRPLLGACLVAVGVYGLWPAGYPYLAPITWLDLPALDYVGLALLLISLAWTLIAQAQMGRSWRIGIDAKNKTELVQTGVFRLTRNPIFLGMRLTLLGLFLVLPNALTLAALALGDSLIQIQVRLEEEFLAKTHGDAYQAYRQHTRRWL
jgi:protein-S-isoprenylcysteine O-methyltransferase Ste14